MLDFGKFHIALISGENGQGKSSLLDALTFALFSKARGVEGNRSGTDDLVTNGENLMEVSFQFVQNGVRYRIVRSFDKVRRHSGVRLEVQRGDDFTNLSEGSIRETDQKIRDIIGMDYDAFVTSSFIMQGKADFFTVKKKEEKIEILREILGLEMYERAHQKALDEINKITGEITGTENEIMHLKEETKDIDILKQNVAAAEENVNYLKKKKIEVENILKGLRKKNARKEILKEKLKNSGSRIKELKNKITILETRILNTKKEISILKEIVIRENEINTEYQKFVEMQKRTNVLLEKQSTVEKLRREREKLISEMEMEKSTIKSKVESLNKTVRKDKENISENEKEIADEEVSLKKLSHEKDQKEKELKSIVDKLTMDKEQLSVFRKKLSVKNALMSEKEKLSASASARKELTLKRMELLKQKLNKLQSEKEKYGKVVSASKVRSELEVLKSEITTLTETLEKSKEDRNRAENDLKHLKERLKEITDKDALITTESAVCPLCGSLLTDNHRKEIKLKYKIEKEKTLSEIKVISDRLNKIRIDISKLSIRLREKNGLLMEREKVLSESIGAESASNQIKVQIKETNDDILALEEKAKSDFFTDDEKSVLDNLRQKLAAFYDINEIIISKEENAVRKNEKTYQEKLQAVHVITNEIIKKRERANSLKSMNVKLAKEISDLSDILKKLREQVENPDFLKEKTEKASRLQDNINKSGFSEEELKKCKSESVALSKYDGLYRKLGEAKGRLQGLEKSLKEYTSEEIQSEKTIQEEVRNKEKIEEALKEYDGIEMSLEKENGNFKEASVDLSESEQKMAALSEKLSTLRLKNRKVEHLSRFVGDKVKEKKIFGVCKNMFGKNGIQLSIIRDALPQIENIANEMLGRMTSNGMSLKFDTIKQLKSRDKSVNTLEISVFDNGEKRRYELFSGGEQFRINIAIRIGISMFLSNISGEPLEMLIIDEGFGSQDENGKGRVLREINSFKDKFKKIVVITHVSDVKENFPYEIHVVKNSEGSHIFIV